MGSRGGRQRSIVWAALAATLLAVGCERKEAPKESAATPPSKPPQTPAAAPAPLAEGTLPPICAELCKRAPALDCGTVASCAKGCVTMIELPVCQPEVKALLSCASAEPDGHWECDPKGPTPTLHERYCAESRSALTDCLKKNR